MGNIPVKEVTQKCIIDGAEHVVELNDTCVVSMTLQAYLLENEEIDGVCFEMKNGMQGIIPIGDKERRKFEKNLGINEVIWGE